MVVDVHAVHIPYGDYVPRVFQLPLPDPRFAMHLHEKKLKPGQKRPMEPLKCALPRNAYSTEFLLGIWSLVGEAHKRGIFKSVKRGVKPAPNRDGGDLYTQTFIAYDEKEFNTTIAKM